MPGRLPTPCRQPRYSQTTTNRNGYCDRHQPRPWQHTRKRPGAHRLGYTAQWQKARRLFLRDEPLCRECGKKGWVVPATVVDHIVPHEGDPFWFWDRDNWQPLCKRCHDRKTATEQHNVWY